MCYSDWGLCVPYYNTQKQKHYLETDDIRPPVVGPHLVWCKARVHSLLRGRAKLHEADTAGIDGKSRRGGGCAETLILLAVVAEPFHFCG